jgi:hypothetical protein
VALLDLDLQQRRRGHVPQSTLLVMRYFSSASPGEPIDMR